MEYISVAEMAKIWNVTKRRILVYCADGRILGAKKIGNMWVLPENAEKPNDARIKEELDDYYPTEIMVCNQKSIRNELKVKLNSIVKEFSNLNITPELFRMNIITGISFALFYNILNTSKKSEIETNIELKNILSNLFFKENDKDSVNEGLITMTFNECLDLLDKYEDNIDALLSWAYQYLNNLLYNNTFSETQFFTEEYMVCYLVNSLNICEMDAKVLDPACGGGNFLIYVLDILCDYNIEKNHSKNDIIEIIVSMVKNLYGYDIDRNITKIATINIKIKALSILKKYGIEPSLELYHKLDTNIFYSENDNKIGSLDKETDKHIIINTVSKNHIRMDDLISNTKYIITNPPFKTVKGMENEMKTFLKKEYPLSKCDVCNSFIERILQMLPVNSRCGIVTQNSWLFLESHKEFRKMILTNYKIDRIVDLGSNSFYDLNGEKASVALVVFTNNKDNRHNIITANLKNKTLAEKEKILLSPDLLNSSCQSFLQAGFLDNIDFRIDLLSNKKFKHLYKTLPQYGTFAIPMQGTSTGNAKELIDYFWNHFNDKDWVLVSKGGGYCKWNGLNHYGLKWGQKGEYISATKGSAMRNVKYFDHTQLVFSDTGTSGLNVRLLKKHQLFVASGPGIRLLSGDKYAHLALLNSRLFSYYIKVTSPKITIAAGYIAKIPTVGELLFNERIIELSKECCQLKEAFNVKRVTNIEYTNQMKPVDVLNIKQWAIYELIDDLELELKRLSKEYILDGIIIDSYGLEMQEKEILEDEIGECAYKINRQPIPNKLKALDSKISKLINERCELKRTKASKETLGCDGILEFMADEYGYNVIELFEFILFNVKKFELLLDRYSEFIMHRLVLECFEYNTIYGLNSKSINVYEVAKTIIDKFFLDISCEEDFILWIKESFNIFHSKTFYNNPFLYYNHDYIEVIQK